jgi:hypothetical protein
VIQNEVFDHLFNGLSGRSNRRCDQTYNKKRYNRAQLALQSQNYFLGVNFLNISGAVGVTGIDQTEPVERAVIVRGGGLNARSIPNAIGETVDPNIGLVNLRVFRSGSSKPQISKDSLRSSVYVSDGQAQPWELNWPSPWTLLPNETIRVEFTQNTATTANTLYAVNLYGVTVDPAYKCEPGILEDIATQIQDTEQRPLYLNLKSENSGGTIRYDAIGAGQTATLVTEEQDEFLLVLGFRRNDSFYLPANTTCKLSGSDGRSFSRSELTIKGFEFFCTPDAGYFRFAVPHLIRKGQALTAHLTTTTTSARNRLEGEINLLCVTV